MKNVVLKYLGAALTLIFFSASAYCSIESLAEALARMGSLHPHHEHDSEPHHDAGPAPAHGHHHSDDAAPKGSGESDDFCCSQLNAIPSQWHNATYAGKDLLLAVAARAAEQVLCPVPLTAHRWRFHDKSPPPRLYSTLFYFLNFPTHAPPSSLAC